MLQGCHLVAHTVIGKGRQIIPFCIFLRTGIQHIQRLLISAEADILGCSLLIAICIALLIGSLPCTAEGIVAIAAVASLGTGIRLGLLRVLDLLIGSVYLLHLLGSNRVTGV